jgi:hypothetical protein
MALSFPKRRLTAFLSRLVGGRFVSIGTPLCSRISTSAEFDNGEYGFVFLKVQWASTSFCFNFPYISTLALSLIIASGTPTLLNRAPTASWAYEGLAMG